MIFNNIKLYNNGYSSNYKIIINKEIIYRCNLNLKDKFNISYDYKTNMLVIDYTADYKNTKFIDITKSTKGLILHKEIYNQIKKINNKTINIKIKVGE